MSSRHSGDFCSAINCKSARCKEDCAGLSFFRLPFKDEDRCRIWIQNMRRQDLLGVTMEGVRRSAYKLCSKHFEDSQFNVPSERKRLVWNAIPTLFDIPNPPPTVTPKRMVKERHQVESSPATQLINNESDLPQSDETMPEKKDHSITLSSKLKSSQNKLYRTQKLLREATAALRAKERDVFAQLSGCLPPATAEFVKTQVKMISKKKNGRRWSDHDKVLALSLYHASKKAYCLLKKIFILPSITTLKKSVRDIQIYPGFNDNIISLLSQKIKAMAPGSEMCSLVFDEMSIKENVDYNVAKDCVEGLEDYGIHGRTKFVANHATVFLLRGLKSNWKQPIGYFLSSGPISGDMLSMLIQESIAKLNAAGLKVKCVVADKGCNNRMAFRKLGVTETTPFFDSEGKKIYILYDPPHLIKNIRNNMKNHGFKTEKGNIQWQQIVNFFNFDQKNTVKMAPKLTRNHITLPPFSSLRVKYATQVLSHSVAAGISCMANLKGNKDAALMETARFIEKFDQLFNAFNSGHLSSHQKMGHALSNESGHIAFLKETLQWLDTITSCSSRQPPCISGWKMSIRALLLLWEDLSENSFSFLLTDRLNQDCIENLFSRIRGHISGVDNPSAREFRSFFRNAMVDSLFHHPEGSNCQEDMDKFIVSFRQMAKSMSMDHQRQCSNPETAVPPGNRSATHDADNLEMNDRDEESADNNMSTDKVLLNSAKDNVLTYIGGYISKRLSPKVCSICQQTLKGEFCDSHDQQLILFKELEGCKEGLTTPSQKVTRLIKEMETIFEKCMPNIMHYSHVKQDFFKVLEEQCTITLNCQNENCHLEQKVKKLYFNIRFNFMLKEFSLSFRQTHQKRNRKIMKLTHV